MFYQYIGYGLPVCQLWFTSISAAASMSAMLYQYISYIYGLPVYQLCIWFTSISVMVYQYIGYGLPVYRLWFTSISTMVYQYIGYGLSVYRLWFTSISAKVYQYIGCSMTAVKKQMFLLIFCSLKMSDTERLREEYNQLVEGTLLTCF